MTEAWPTREEIAQVLDFDDFPSGVALELIAAQVAVREKAAAEKALREAAACLDNDDETASWLRVRADVLAGEGER
jgi:hypothetical protein